MLTIASLSRRLKHSFSASDILFYILILLAALSPPVWEYQGDFLTAFDIYLLFYALYRALSGGLRFRGTHWRTLVLVYVLYLAFLAIGVLRVQSLFSLLLLIKHAEHLVFLLILIERFEETREPGKDIKVILLLLLLVIAYQILYFHGMIPGIGDNRFRLGLPFMRGTSSNPAGFFLGALLIYLIHRGFALKLRTGFILIILLAALYALFMTDSRTNILAFMFVLAVSAGIAVWRSRQRWPLLAGLLALAALLYFLVLPQIPASWPLGEIAEMLKEPSRILNDRSFSVRYSKLWPMGIEAWLSGPLSIVIGKGIGHFVVIDGTVPRLLGEQGVVGLLFFLYVWYAHFILHVPSKALGMLLLFSFINGLNGETLVVSYRSIQLYLVLLTLTIYSGRISADEGERPPRRTLKSSGE